MKLRKRLLLWLPVAIFFAVWAATAWWGTADVEQHLLTEHIHQRKFAHLYPLVPKDYQRVAWGKTAPEGPRAVYAMTARSPFPLVVLCDYEVTRRGLNHYRARQWSLWLAGRVWEGEDTAVRVTSLRQYRTLRDFLRQLNGTNCG